MNLKMTLKKYNVTVVLTSCGRFDLLEQTVDSFFRHNTYPLYEFILIEDSGKELPYFLRNYNINVIKNKENLGQVRSIDLAYSKVMSEYIFHCEDDWFFYRDGFIEESIKILDFDKKIINVWIRDKSDTNGHPYQNAGFFYIMSNNYKNKWHGFTWNPGLRRLSDYKLIGKYSDHTNFNRHYPFLSEIKIGKIYNGLGYYAAMTKNGYVKHIGENRTIKITI